jgi:integrase
VIVEAPRTPLPSGRSRAPRSGSAGARSGPRPSSIGNGPSGICCRSSPIGPLPKIDVWAVDAYRLHKLEESEDRRRRLAEGRPRTDALGRPLRPLSASSINKTIEVLRWLLSFAVEYGWIDDNPTAGRRRRIKVERSPAPHLESAGQIAGVLDAAAELDADAGRLIDDRLPVVATLVFAGLRVHELTALRWGDLDFTT